MKTNLMCKPKKNLVLKIAKHFKKDMEEVGIFTHQYGFDELQKNDYIARVFAEKFTVLPDGAICEYNYLGTMNLIFRLESDSSIEMYVSGSTNNDFGANLLRGAVNRARLLVEVDYWASQHGDLLKQYTSETNRFVNNKVYLLNKEAF